MLDRCLIGKGWIRIWIGMELDGKMMVGVGIWITGSVIAGGAGVGRGTKMVEGGVEVGVEAAVGA